MKIRFNRSIYCRELKAVAETGKVYDLKNPFAKDMVNAGLAEEVKGEKVKAEKPKEKPKAKPMTKGNTIKKPNKKK